jgi:hypothetical protein
MFGGENSDLYFVGLAQAATRANAENVEGFRAQVAGLKEEIRQLQLAFALEQANCAGQKAQLQAFKQAHPESALLAKTTATFRDGERKTKSRLIFEDAFKKKARELGIRNPEQILAKD